MASWSSSAILSSRSKLPKSSLFVINSITTWPQLFNAIRGEYGVRARVYGIVFFLSLVTGIVGMASFFIVGIFCT